MNDLNPDMQARLDKWKQNILPVPSADILRGKSPPNFVPRQRDYGDDIRDYERKEEASWNREFQNNPIYNGYR